MRLSISELPEIFLIPAPRTFNAGEMVKVSSSTGWMVFLTLLYSLARLFHFENNFPLFISIINAFTTFAGVVVYIKIVELLLAERFSITKKLLFGIPYLALILPASIGLMGNPICLIISRVGDLSRNPIEILGIFAARICSLLALGIIAAGSVDQYLQLLQTSIPVTTNYRIYCCWYRSLFCV